MTPFSSEIFGILKVPRRVWAVAAVHGEAERLTALHHQIGQRFLSGDRLVYLGNYIGHGRDVIATVDELLLFRREILCTPGTEPEDVVYLRGAQEEMWRKLLQLQFAPAPKEVFDWMLRHGVESSLRAYGGSPEEGRARFREGPLAVTRWTSGLREAMRRHAGHEDLMSALRRAAYSEHGELLFVHAGVDPHRPLSEQNDTFWWGSGYFAGMQEPFAGFKLVVSGYDRDRHGFRHGAVSSCLDGGAGFGGRLNAGCFDLSGQLVDWIEV